MWMRAEDGCRGSNRETKAMNRFPLLSNKTILFYFIVEGIMNIHTWNKEPNKLLHRKLAQNLRLKKLVVP